MHNDLDYTRIEEARQLIANGDSIVTVSCRTCQGAGSDDPQTHGYCPVCKGKFRVTVPSWQQWDSHGKIDYWQARALIAEAPAWQPLATAPKDGTHVLMYRAGPRAVFDEAWWKLSKDGIPAQWGGQGWWYADHMLPSHWMPLPAPPEQPAVEEAVTTEVTRDWLEVFQSDLAAGKDLSASVFWRLALHSLPEGVDPNHGEVQAALAAIRQACAAREVK